MAGKPVLDHGDANVRYGTALVIANAARYSGQAEHGRKCRVVIKGLGVRLTPATGDVVGDEAIPFDMFGNVRLYPGQILFG